MSAISAHLKRNPKRGFTELTLLLGVVLLLVGAFVASATSLGVFIIFIGLILGVYWLSTRCPACGRWGARKTVGREVLSKEGGFKTVYRKSHTTNSDGSTSTTTYPEQIHVVHYKHQNHFQCSYCGHHWSNITSSTVEG